MAKTRTKSESDTKKAAGIEEKGQTKADKKSEEKTEDLEAVSTEKKPQAKKTAKKKKPQPKKAAKASEPAEGREAGTGAISQTIQKMAQSLDQLPPEDVPGWLGIFAKDIMRREVVWGGPDESVQESLTKMEQADASYMIVGTQGVPEGIVSKCDLTGTISPYLRPMFAKWRRPLDDATLQIKIKLIMSTPVHSVTLETSLAEIMEKMRQSRRRCLAVIDPQDQIQGLVTTFDIFDSLLNTNFNVLSATEKI